MKKGMIFKIQKFCLDDGPGIRTTVFLKGCTLKCSWCHNGEGLNKEPSLGYFEEKCRNCHVCEQVCPVKAHYWEKDVHLIKRDICIGCGRCAKNCLENALKWTGREYSVEEVMKEVRKDIAFYAQSKGGVTLSGGEPLLQADFCLEIARACKTENIDVTIETSGHIERNAIEMLLPYTQLWLFDIKESREDIFRRVTGGKLSLVLENLEFLKQRKSRILLRCPIVTGIQDREEYFVFLKELSKGTQGVQLMPYHNTGFYKGKAYGIKEQREFAVPEQQKLAEWIEKYKFIKK